MNILIAGCGYVGEALGRRLSARGHRVIGLKRDPSALHPSLIPFAADLTDPDSLKAFPDADIVFYTAAADASTEEAYARAYIRGPETLLQVLERRAKPPMRVFFTSSTAVYDHKDGEWVDERSPTTPENFRGKALLAGEARFLASPFAATVVRFGGIYGPGRTRLIEKVRTGQAVLHSGSPRYTNRIHRDDCAAILEHLMALENADPLYVGVDCEPTGENDVLSFIARELGVSLSHAPHMDERLPARSHKRCSNAKLLASGYRFIYPTFREGYRDLIQFASNDTLFRNDQEKLVSNKTIY